MTEMTPTQVREFVLENGNVMTNQQMAVVSGVPRTRISSAISKLKLSGELTKGWLKDEQLSKEIIDGQLKVIFSKTVAIGKDIAREMTATAVVTSGVTGCILTLPSYTCAIENLINKYSLASKNLFTYFAVERDPLAHKEMLATANRKGIIFEGTSTKDLLHTIERSRENDFAHILADYCGQIHKHEQDIALAMNNNLVPVGGLICITLMRRLAAGGGIKFRNKIESIIPYDKNKVDSEGNELTQTDQLIVNFIKITGNGRYEMVGDPWRYCDSTVGEDGKKIKGANMGLFILKRVK